MNHLQSLKFESKLYAMVKDKMEEMQQHNMSWIEVKKNVLSIYLLLPHRTRPDLKYQQLIFIIFTVSRTKERGNILLYPKFICQYWIINRFVFLLIFFINKVFFKVQFLKKSLDILCDCRRTLMYTYVFAYYLRKNNQSAIFEVSTGVILLLSNFVYITTRKLLNICNSVTTFPERQKWLPTNSKTADNTMNVV